MKKIITKPHLFFFALIPIVLIVGYVLKNESLNLNIYDSYFVATFNHISYFFATFLGLVGLNYLSLHWGNKKTIKWMTAAHIILQVFSLLLFFTKDNWNWLSKDEHPTTLQMSMGLFKYCIDFINFNLYTFCIYSFN